MVEQQIKMIFWVTFEPLFNWDNLFRQLDSKNCSSHSRKFCAIFVKTYPTLELALFAKVRKSGRWGIWWERKQKVNGIAFAIFGLIVMIHSYTLMMMMMENWENVKLHKILHEMFKIKITGFFNDLKHVYTCGFHVW